ncbi:MAG: hypothetical protein H6Q06_1847 [Acidobacteria bacterium]|nr:hypothetical protein [Acidobacteriota bacterium]
MKHRTGKVAALVAVVTALFVSVSYGQEEKPKPESYTAVAMGTGGSVGGKSMPFDFRITKWTTDEEVKQYMELLKESGQDALRRTLEKEDRGQLSPVGRVGNTIAVARKRQAGSETIITIVTARIMPFVELYRGGRSTDYQFGFLQVKLNEKGEGMGNIMAACKLRFDKKKGQYEIESYGNQYIKAVNVRPNK